MEHLYTSQALLNNNNPKWPNDTTVDFDLDQEYLLQVHDYDPAGKFDPIGNAVFLLNDDIFDNGMVVGLTKEGKKKPSKKMLLTIKGQRRPMSNLEIKVDFRCTKLKKSGFFASKDTTAIAFSRLNADGTESQVYFSELIESSQKPDWAPFTMSFADLCDADMNKPFLLRMYKQRSDGYMTTKGENKKLTVQQLLVKQGEEEKKIDLFDLKGNDICDIYVERFELCEVHEEKAL